ncbi:chromate efflux transporter [Gammaproteobacteria bacterium]|nr:chromate efflux transporter [Gammaproteobacteria bacterium]
MSTVTLEDGIDRPQTPSLGQACRVWLRIGLLSFGGPAAQIALMHREIVEGKRWLSEQQYLNALSFCMLLPGPEAMQLATYAGWRLHGTLGGLLAGLLFVLPGAVVILALALIYVLYGELPLVNALFLGVKAAVIIIVIEALLRVARRALLLPEHWLVAALAFVGIFFFALPFPLIIILAAIFGFLRTQRESVAQPRIQVKASPFTSLVTIVIWVLIWALPMLALVAFDEQGLLLDIGVFFSKLAVVTFGGAYAVLAYLGQDVVVQFGWLSAGEMMDGLGLAETTPGPLILVNEFVGFIAAFRQGGFWYGFLGAVVTLWVTFTPCFLWIFVGAPYIDWIASQARLRGALTAITAAVVGVILNLSIWFALHVFFSEVSMQEHGPLVLWWPQLESLDWRVMLLSLLCAVLLLGLHWGISRVLSIAAVGGVLLSLVSF